MSQANGLRSCKAGVCLHDCRQPLSGEGGFGEKVVAPGACRSNDGSRALTSGNAEVVAIGQLVVSEKRRE